MLGKIESHTAKPMSKEEIEAHIADYDRLRQLCSEQSSALKWAKELLEMKGLANDEMRDRSGSGTLQEH
ncbi:MAG: hypothetical protein IPM06_18310 [Rhizobiales bacterium]|nr:hypothetical protein [Hyphomicrobiales bacterium]